MSDRLGCGSGKWAVLVKDSPEARTGSDETTT